MLILKLESLSIIFNPYNIKTSEIFKKNRKTEHLYME